MTSNLNATISLPNNVVQLVNTQLYSCKFFYLQQNAFYYIECELLTIPGLTAVDDSNLFVFRYFQPNTKLTYQVTCRKLPNMFINMLMNKIFLNIKLVTFGYLQQLEFSESDKEILKSSLNNELAYYLALNNESNNFLHQGFVHEYKDYVNFHLQQCANNDNDPDQGNYSSNF